VSRDRKDTASAEHHYFPRALQKFWRDDAGWVWRLTASGELKGSKNGTFGQLRNAHRIKFSDEESPWDESFEFIFRKADDSIPETVAMLSEADAPFRHEGAKEWRQRLAPQWHLQATRGEISELIASLVVRSPAVRNLIRVGVDDFWSRSGGPPPFSTAPDHLIAANQRPLLDCYAKALSERGKFVVLLSDHREFVFGDGMMNNFQSGLITPNNPRCLVPITPTIAVAYDCPSSYSQSADFVAARVSPNEVNELNWLTQVYSGKHLFYRSELPRDLTAFQLGKHQQVRYHRSPWLDALMREAASMWFDKGV
jgi:hypothetical protein